MRITLVRCVAAFAALLAAATPLRADDVPVNARIQRYSMLVGDIDRSLRVYRDVLGYKFTQTSVVGPDSYIRKVFGVPKTADVRSALLDGPDGTPRALFLLEVKGVELPRPQPPYMLTVLLRVDNYQRVLDGVRGLGLAAIGPDQFEAQGGRITELSFIDPDGHLIVLFQRDPLPN
jgi:catechol 2,3-dioxygenase-like lactoylglutathione lyase family enzyme